MNAWTKKVHGSTGWVSNNALHVPCIYNGTAIGNLVLDTGNFELTFSSEAAKRLKLPHMGTQEIMGVDGKPFMVSTSQVQWALSEGDVLTLPCIINPYYTTCDGLIGMRALIEHNLDIRVSWLTATFELFEGQS